jgi:hypothetical protein
MCAIQEDSFRAGRNPFPMRVEMTSSGPDRKLDSGALVSPFGEGLNVLRSRDWRRAGRYLTSKVTSSGLWSDGITPFSSRVSKTCAARTTSADAPLEKNT